MTTAEHIVVDGYDLLAEKARDTFPVRTLCGRSLHRGRARLAPDGLLRSKRQSGDSEARVEHDAEIMPTALDDASRAIDLSYPASGMFVDSPEGLYMDLSQGLNQKIVDDQHPLIQECIATLVEHKLIFRRESNADDYVFFGREFAGLHTPQELARQINRLTVERLPEMGACQTFFSNSGAEAGEAGLRLARLSACRRFVETHGHDLLARLMADLGIARETGHDIDAVFPEPRYADSPFFLVGCDNAFHGCTAGVLALTRSSTAPRLSGALSRWVAQVPFNGELKAFEELFDERPITQILEAPGGVRRVIDEGRIPADLFAGFVVEVYQAEGGYRIADREWLAGIAETTRRRGGLLCVDEVLSFGRTGQLYAVEHMGVTPDILWTASAAVLGITVARRELSAAVPFDRHGHALGSGKLFDVNMAWVTFHLLTEHHEPVFEGRTLLENSRIKGEYVRMGLAELSAAHPEVLPAFSGLGCMWGLSVEHREEVLATAWRQGLKLLGCGPPGETSRIRLVLLADVLTHEVDQLMAALGRVFAAVEGNHPDK